MSPANFCILFRAFQYAGIFSKYKESRYIDFPNKIMDQCAGYKFIETEIGIIYEEYCHKKNKLVFLTKTKDVEFFLYMHEHELRYLKSGKKVENPKQYFLDIYNALKEMNLEPSCAMCIHKHTHKLSGICNEIYEAGII